MFIVVIAASTIAFTTSGIAAIAIKCWDFTFVPSYSIETSLRELSNHWSTWHPTFKITASHYSLG